MAQVKICGLSEPVTMKAALDAGADMVGLVFFAKSPRNVNVEQAAALAKMAKGKAAVVALVVDADDKLFELITKRVRPDYFQVHGNETPNRVLEIAKLSGVKVIKALAVREASDVAKAQSYFRKADLILFDAKAPDTLKDALPGGNGISFDWTLLKGNEGPYMLSGGLSPENVAEAIAMTGAPIVDVSSGVETAPGIKDASLIRKFIEQAKLSS